MSSQHISEADELQHEALYPLSLRLSRLAPGLERPVFRRVHHSLVVGSADHEQWRGYLVRQDGHAVLMLEAEYFGFSPTRSWLLREPVWSLAVLEVPWDLDKLLGEAIRAVLLVSTVDSPHERVTAAGREWDESGWLNVLQETGWTQDSKSSDCYVAPACHIRRSGALHRELVVAFWRTLGTSTLGEALLTFEVARRLAERWEVNGRGEPDGEERH